MFGPISKPPVDSSPYEEFMRYVDEIKEKRKDYDSVVKAITTVGDNNDVWSSSGTAINSGSQTWQSTSLSEHTKRKIIEDMGIVAISSIDITELDEFVKENGDSFKAHTKKTLSEKFVELIMQKAVFTQQKISNPMPRTRIKSRVIIMSEDELLKLMDDVRNY